MKFKYKKAWMAALVAAGMAISLTGCGGTSGSSSSASAAPSGPVKETMKPFAVRQVVAADNEKGRTIMWQLPNEKDSTLEYRKKDSEAIQSVKADAKAYKGNNGIADSYIYTAHVTGLEKGNTYEYRTRTGDTVSKWYPMKTDNGGSFKAIVTSDSQSSDYSDWEKLFQGAAK